MIEIVGIILFCVVGYKYYVEDDETGEEIEKGRRYLPKTT